MVSINTKIFKLFYITDFKTSKKLFELVKDFLYVFLYCSIIIAGEWRKHL